MSCSASAENLARTFSSNQPFTLLKTAAGQRITMCVSDKLRKLFSRSCCSADPFRGIVVVLRVCKRRHSWSVVLKFCGGLLPQAPGCCFWEGQWDNCRLNSGDAWTALATPENRLSMAKRTQHSVTWRALIDSLAAWMSLWRQAAMIAYGPIGIAQFTFGGSTSRGLRNEKLPTTLLVMDY